MRGLLVAMVVVGTFGQAAAERPAPRTKPAAARAWGAGPTKSRPSLLLASFKGKANPDPKTAGKARTLQAQGMAAYQSGNYGSAIRKFAAALEAAPTPELLYQAAQAYRLAGDRAMALELYERYLAVAPEGSAATVCRWYSERLRATP